jgi:hypothetical protein
MRRKFARRCHPSRRAIGCGPAHRTDPSTTGPRIASATSTRKPVASRHSRGWPATRAKGRTSRATGSRDSTAPGMPASHRWMPRQTAHIGSRTTRRRPRRGKARQGICRIDVLEGNPDVVRCHRRTDNQQCLWRVDATFGDKLEKPDVRHGGRASSASDQRVAVHEQQLLRAARLSLSAARSLPLRRRRRRRSDAPSARRDISARVDRRG